MVEIDLTKLSEKVSTILMLRGSSLPPLCLGEHPHPQASDLLEALPDDELFGVPQINDVDLAMAIRALLYIRNGYINEGNMFAMMASETEREFICGISERNLGHADRAKSHFQKVIDYPVFNVLNKEVLALLKNSMDKRLARLHGIIELNGNWEPHAFIDLYEEARTSTMSSASLETVRTIQAWEFNALFLYCYEKLTNIDARKAEIKRTIEAPRRRPAPTRKPAPAPAPQPAADADQSASPSKRTTSTHKASSNEVRVGCPKCKSIQTFDASQRGTKAHCSKCATGFTIPGGKTATTPSAGSAVKVACPKCRTTGSYPQAKRGTKVQCSKCGAGYTIPSRVAAA